MKTTRIRAIIAQTPPSPPISHAHIIGDVTGLQSALDGKQASGSYASASHSHIIADTTWLQAALDGKQASGSYASSTHSHAISDTTGLQAALDGKLSTSAASGWAKLSVGTSAPVGPSTGDLWVDTN